MSTGVSLAVLGVREDERALRLATVLPFGPLAPSPLGLPALVVAVSVGFTRTKGYGTSS